MKHVQAVAFKPGNLRSLFAGGSDVAARSASFLQAVILPVTVLGLSSLTGEALAADASGPFARNSLEEIVVTAQKRTERLQDVPVPVTAISAQSLVESNQTRLEDYYTQVPGLNLTITGDGATPALIIRGISTGGANNPTVSTVIDDIPFGPSTALQGGFEAPDIDPSDLARIEVLRGPQGTLYGASSLGGLVKIVTLDPSTEGVSGRVQVGSETIEKGGDVGYNVRAAVNVPISDTWAIRASGFKRVDPGYVDRVQTGERDANTVEAEGGRLSALWRPSDAFSLKLGVLVQDTTADASSVVNLGPGLGELQQTGTVPESGGYEKKMQLFNATMTARLGSFDLTSLTGYGVNSITSHADVTPSLGAFGTIVFGAPGAVSSVQYDTPKFTQELRLSTTFADRVHWTFGGFYTREATRLDQTISVVNPTKPVLDPNTGALVDYWLMGLGKRYFKEEAVFSDITLDITDRFNVQVGGRYSHNDQRLAPQQIAGPYYSLLQGLPFASVNPQQESKDDSTTYLVTPQFKVSDDLMVYARMASGYRPGGVNNNPALLALVNLPVQYGPDTTRNYEIGVKGNILNHALSFDASAYRIDWQDIQLQLLDPTILSAYRVNGSQAKSQGVELSVESKPLTGLSIAGWVAYDDAKLTENLPPSLIVGKAGERLPFSSRFSANLSVDEEFPLGNTMAFAGATASYIGDRKDAFGRTATRLDLPAYTQVDVRAGIKWDSLAVTAFVNNVADKRASLLGDPASLTGGVYFIQPRTIGVNIAQSF